MPGPLTIPLLGAGADIGGQLISAASQAAQNKKARKWQLKMYEVQRMDALKDWTMQNEYNSPAAQMQRLKMAGLNPNLVYGNGATTTAGAPRSSDAGNWNPQAPQIDLGGAFGTGLSAYYDTQIKEAQTDNLKAQNTVLLQEGLLKAAQVLDVTASSEQRRQTTKGMVFDLGVKEELRQNSIEVARQGLHKMIADTQYTLNANETQIAMRQPNLTKALEEILTLRAQRANTVMEKQKIHQQIEMLKKDNTYRQMEIDLLKQGVGPNSPFYAKIIARILGDSNAERKYRESGQRSIGDSTQAGRAFKKVPVNVHKNRQRNQRRR